MKVGLKEPKEWAIAREWDGMVGCSYTELGLWFGIG